MNDYKFDGEYAKIPTRMQYALLEYVLRGKPSGDFLRSVLFNDLFGAVGHADDENLPLLPLYVRWLYNIAPSGCFGSKDKCLAWCKDGGMDGINAKRSAACSGS